MSRHASQGRLLGTMLQVMIERPWPGSAELVQAGSLAVARHVAAMSERETVASARFIAGRGGPGTPFERVVMDRARHIAQNEMERRQQAPAFDGEQQE